MKLLNLVRLRVTFTRINYGIFSNSRLLVLTISANLDFGLGICDEVFLLIGLN